MKSQVKTAFESFFFVTKQTQHQKSRLALHEILSPTIVSSTLEIKDRVGKSGEGHFHTSFWKNTPKSNIPSAEKGTLLEKCGGPTSDHRMLKGHKIVPEYCAASA